MVFFLDLLGSHACMAQTVLAQMLMWHVHADKKCCAHTSSALQRTRYRTPNTLPYTHMRQSTSAHPPLVQYSSDPCEQHGRVPHNTPQDLPPSRLCPAHKFESAAECVHSLHCNAAPPGPPAQMSIVDKPQIYSVAGSKLALSAWLSDWTQT